MTFELKPGDWIPTCEVPEDKRQAVIDAFVKSGTTLGPKIVYDDDWFGSWPVMTWCSERNRIDFCYDDYRGMKRRVSLHQILGKEITENANCSWAEVGPELLQAAKVALQALDYYDEYNERHMAAPGMLKAAIERAKGAS